MEFSKEQLAWPRSNHILALCQQQALVAQRLLDAPTEADRRAATDLDQRVAAEADEFLEAALDTAKPSAGRLPLRRIFISYDAYDQPGALEHAENLYRFLSDANSGALYQREGQTRRSATYGAAVCCVGVAIITSNYITSELALLEYAILSARCRRAARRHPFEFHLLRAFFGPPASIAGAQLFLALPDNPNCSTYVFYESPPDSIAAFENDRLCHKMMNVAQRHLPPEQVFYDPEVARGHIDRLGFRPGSVVARWNVRLFNELDPANARKLIDDLFPGVRVTATPGPNAFFGCYVDDPELQRRPQEFVKRMLETFGTRGVHVEPLVPPARPDRPLRFIRADPPE
jgi:hypothetical protein